MQASLDGEHSHGTQQAQHPMSRRSSLRYGGTSSLCIIHSTNLFPGPVWECFRCCYCSLENSLLISYTVSRSLFAKSKTNHTTNPPPLSPSPFRRQQLSSGRHGDTPSTSGR